MIGLDVDEQALWCSVMCTEFEQLRQWRRWAADIMIIIIIIIIIIIVIIVVVVAAAAARQTAAPWKLTDN